MLPVDINFRRDLGAAKRIHLPWWMLLALALSAAFCAALFDHIGRIDLALPVMNSLVVFGYLIKLRWNLKTRIWFWGTMIVCAALHVPLMMSIPWTIKWVPPFAIATLDTVDFWVILAILSVIGRFMSERETSMHE